MRAMYENAEININNCTEVLIGSIMIKIIVKKKLNAAKMCN